MALSLYPVDASHTRLVWIRSAPYSCAHLTSPSKLFADLSDFIAVRPNRAGRHGASGGRGRKGHRLPTRSWLCGCPWPAIRYYPPARARRRPVSQPFVVCAERCDYRVTKFHREWRWSMVRQIAVVISVCVLGLVVGRVGGLASNVGAGSAVALALDSTQGQPESKKSPPPDVAGSWCGSINDMDFGMGTINLDVNQKGANLSGS